MDLVRAANRVDAHLGESDVPNVPGLHEVGDGADRVFDRNRRVETRRTVDVDDLDAEALQAVRGERLHRDGTRVDTEPASVGSPERAELHRELHAIAPPGHGAADEQLVVAHPVEVAGVEQGDAAIDGGLNGAHALGVVGRAVHA